MSKDTGGRAFPSGDMRAIDSGMTLRDWFAGMALQGLLSSYDQQLTTSDVPMAADSSYQIADAMIAERSK